MVSQNLSLSTSRVRNLDLAAQGNLKIHWAQKCMPVLTALKEEAAETRPLEGARIAASLHVTKETAVFMHALKTAGAQIALCGSDVLTVQDDVAAALTQDISVFAWHGMNTQEFYSAINSTLEIKPTLTIDDGAALISTVHLTRTELAHDIIGGTEETASGAARIRSMARDGVLKYPVILYNDSELKWDFDNIHGTGQSTIEAIIRCTNILLAGKVVVIAGFGPCGRGCAKRARGMGARVVITEVDHVAALKAVLDGYEVMMMDKAALVGEVFITTTGIKNVIVSHHFKAMKNGAILCNTGYENWEVDVDALREISRDCQELRKYTEEYTLLNGKRIIVLAQGHIVNLAASEGHLPEVMDISFSNQFLGIIKLVKEQRKMKPGIYESDKNYEQEIAKRKLNFMGLEIDTLTKEQTAYLHPRPFY